MTTRSWTTFHLDMQHHAKSSSVARYPAAAHSEYRSADLCSSHYNLIGLHTD